ncbi:MAG: type II secretion system minor pseudopilin GspI [Lysobacterales bacterium]
MRQLRGFTLIEVMVALAILAIALAASVRAVGEQSRAQAIVRDGSYARWVAANLIAETRLNENWPAPGVREGQSRMAGRIWRWRLTITDTPDGDMRRLDAEVYPGEASVDAEDALVRVSGFASGRDRGE